MSARGAGAVSGALTGAMAGSAVMPGIGTAIGAGIGAIGGYFGGSSQDDANEAAQKIAEEQLKAQRENRDLALGYAAPSMEEIQNMEGMLKNMQRAYAYQAASHQRDSKILEAQYPGIIAAAQNMYDLQTGKEAPILAPMRQQQAMQKEALKATLARQLGSGWETSSAGIEAMTRFDQNSSMALQQAQLQSMGAVAGAGSALTGDYQSVRGNDNRDALTISEMGSSYENMNNAIKNRQINAANQTNTAGYEGASHVSDELGGQYGSQMWKNTMGAGTQLAGMYAMSKSFGRPILSSDGSTSWAGPGSWTGPSAAKSLGGDYNMVEKPGSGGWGYTVN